MSESTNITDEQLAAWLHGSLEGDEALRIEKLVSDRADLAQRVMHLQKLDDIVRKAIPKEETLPDELLARLGITAVPTTDNVVDFATVRANRASSPKPKKTYFAALSSGSLRVAAQLVLVIGLGVGAAQWMFQPKTAQDKGDYHVLGEDEDNVAPPNAMLLFRPDVDPNDAKAIIKQSNGRVIGVPTDAGVWKIYINPALRDEALSKLRAKDEVRMAEPVDGPAS